MVTPKTELLKEVRAAITFGLGDSKVPNFPIRFIFNSLLDQGLSG
jgi:hypothetical protein